MSEAGYERIQWAIGRAVHEPCRIVLHDGGHEVFVTRLYERLRSELDAGRIPFGIYRGEVMVGSARVALDITVQGDLFGKASVVIDRSALDALVARRSARL